MLEFKEKPSARAYPIRRPAIKSGDTYYFRTDSGLEYEVRFGRMKDNFYRRIINFGVLNDEFDDEYSTTNRGEVYRIMATVIKVIKMYHEASNNDEKNSYEFMGEFKHKNSNRKTSVRTQLYYRYATRLFRDNWEVKLEGNKVVMKKKGVEKKAG